MLVGTVLIPERAHDAKLRERGRAAEQREQSLIFLCRETMLGDERRGDGRVARSSRDGHADTLASMD